MQLPIGQNREVNKLAQSLYLIATLTRFPKTLAALETLQKHENPTHNPMQNAVRKYYKFRNGKDFPRKKDFN